ncbi:hypothetical protein Tco_1577690 [Tanacetum coccineum]
MYIGIRNCLASWEVENTPWNLSCFCSGGGGGGSSVVVVSVFSVTLEGYISCATLNLKNTHPHRYDPFSIARAVVIFVGVEIRNAPLGMKWCRMSMCLDRECWTLLQLRAMALLLSQYRGILLNRKP